MNRYQSLIDTFGQDHFDKVQESRILVVGAGGIGCEVLKNLVISGFRSIEVIDLDTIDVSNLNRQFLFRTEHVGQPKAVVAAAAAKAFNPNVTIIAHHSNVKDAQFGLDYIRTFHVVLNALDNIDARRHVNRLCLAADVPLIDSGTTGYLGQVMPVFKKRTACYECMPKPHQKVYPICTIRSTPDKPVHCIVWAKECFKLLFGNVSESMLYEDPALREESTYMALVPFPDGIEDDMEKFSKHCMSVITALYVTELKKRIAMDVYKTAKVAPKLTSLDAISSAGVKALKIIRSNPAAAQRELEADWDRVVWDDETSIVEMIVGMWEALVSRTFIGKMVFDKDDSLAMRFVCAASNVRSNTFGIKPMNYHDAKGMAGNIIPAIATTNAIVAGVQVLQAFKLLRGDTLVAVLPSDLTEAQKLTTKVFRSVTPHTYCQRLPTRRGYYLDPTSPDFPLSSCYVCSKPQLDLMIDTAVSTLGDLLRYVVKGRLSFNQPTIALGSSIIYEEGEDADEDCLLNLPKTLASCPAGGIVCGSMITISDQTQDLTVKLVVHHVTSDVLLSSRANTEEAIDSPGELFTLLGADEFAKNQADEALIRADDDASGRNQDPGLDVDDEDGIIVFYNTKNVDDDEKNETLPAAVDRKRGREEEEENSNKR